MRMTALPKANRRVREGRWGRGRAFSMLGGTTAASMAVTRLPAQKAAAIQPAPLPANRIAVSANSIRDAYAKGQIDRPIQSILNVPTEMYSVYLRGAHKGLPEGARGLPVPPRAQL